MIRKFSITVSKFIEQYIFTEKRLPNRLKLFRVLLYPFTVISNTYRVWRNDVIIQANVTVSKKSVEWYLNHKFDSELQRIYIDTNKGGGILMGDRDVVGDAALYQIMGDRDEVGDAALYQIMTAYREHPEMEFYPFAVYVPADLMSQADAIRGAMDVYAVTDFTIIEI